MVLRKNAAGWDPLRIGAGPTPSRDEFVVWLGPAGPAPELMDAVLARLQALYRTIQRWSVMMVDGRLTTLPARPVTGVTLALHSEPVPEGRAGGAGPPAYSVGLLVAKADELPTYLFLEQVDQVYRDLPAPLRAEVGGHPLAPLVEAWRADRRGGAPADRSAPAPDL